MIPFGNQTVTLIRRVENSVNGKTVVTYAANTITGCTWRRVSTLRRVDMQTERGISTSCRMPPGVMPSVGDVLVLGSVKNVPKSSAELEEILHNNRPNNAFIITAVSDNARPGFPIPHYSARGE